MSTSITTPTEGASEPQVSPNLEPLPSATQIPWWVFRETHVRKCLRGEADWDWYVTNGHVLLAVSHGTLHDGFERLPDVAFAVLMPGISAAKYGVTPGLPYARREDDENANAIDIRLGRSTVLDVRYYCLVERLYPGCEWRAPEHAGRLVVAAFRGSQLVALVMPRKPATELA